MNKTTEVNYHVRIYLKDIFGFASNQDACTYGLGYKLTLQRKSDNNTLSHRAGTKAESLVLAGRFNIEDLSWYIPNFTPSMSNQHLTLAHIVSKAPTDLSFVKRPTYMKDVTTENNWTFELGLGYGVDIPIYVIVGFKQRDQVNQQHRNNYTFYRPSVLNA